MKKSNQLTARDFSEGERLLAILEIGERGPEEDMVV
jgi:hypothetical protein